MCVCLRVYGCVLQLVTVQEATAKAGLRDKFWRGVQYGSKGVFSLIAVLIDRAEAAGVCRCQCVRKLGEHNASCRHALFRH